MYTNDYLQDMVINSQVGNGKPTTIFIESCVYLKVGLRIPIPISVVTNVSIIGIDLL